MLVWNETQIQPQKKNNKKTKKSKTKNIVENVISVIKKIPVELQM